MDELLRHCVDFGNTFEGDVDGLSFYDEILYCRMLFKKRHNRAVPPPVSPEELLQATVEYGKDVFPNLRTALQILLTMSVSVVSWERSFSKLKLIKKLVAIDHEPRTFVESCHSINRKGSVRVY